MRTLQYRKVEKQQEVEYHPKGDISARGQSVPDTALQDSEIPLLIQFFRHQRQLLSFLVTKLDKLSFHGEPGSDKDAEKQILPSSKTTSFFSSVAIISPAALFCFLLFIFE